MKRKPSPALTRSVKRITEERLERTKAEMLLEELKNEMDTFIAKYFTILPEVEKIPKEERMFSIDYGDFVNIVKHFTKWQKKQIQKGSKIGVVAPDNRIELSRDKSIDLDPYMQNTPAFKLEPYTKVRVIIVKEN